MLLEQSTLFECMLKKNQKIKGQVRDFTGFKIDAIQSAVFSWLKKKKKDKNGDRVIGKPPNCLDTQLWNV